MTSRPIKLPDGYRITKDGKKVAAAPKKKQNVSQRIAEKKNPKRTWRGVR